MILFFRELDFFCEDSIVKRSPKLSTLVGVECTESQANQFFYKTEDIEDGKQRKKGTLKLEDIPEPTDSELAISQIATLESQQTPRRLREAALGDTDSIAFLKDIDDQISELRKSLSD